MPERYSMYDPVLRGIVMRLLYRWKRLPLSDLLQLLTPDDRLLFRGDVIDDLVWKGLVLSQMRGDELVVSITSSGVQWVQNHPGAPVVPAGQRAEEAL